jgi:predicted enzyme related to lactoylglutathione lyase
MSWRAHRDLPRARAGPTALPSDSYDRGSPVPAGWPTHSRGRPPFDGGHGSIKTGPMTSRISHTSVDARDSYQQSVFWAAVLDWIEDPDDPNLPEHDECLIMSRDRAELILFINVPDEKVVKNRLHLDLRPVDRTREAEVARLVQLGATEVADFRRPDGSGWITLTDPEGNEFCVLSQTPAGSGSTT